MNTDTTVRDDPWLRYLPEVHRALAAPDFPNGLPRSFIGLNFEQTCAWWETLRYIFRSLLGWKSLPTGLAWWYEAGKPTLGDPLLELIRERWDARGELDYFAAREWESGGDSVMGSYESEWHVGGYEPSPGWFQELQVRPRLMEYGPYGGGANPLHLGHSDFLSDGRSKRPSTGFHDVKTLHAILIVAGFDSWQRDLRDYGTSLPPLAERSWKVRVFDRKLGSLGLFRRSRVTGRWFQGKHSIHMAGNRA